MVNGQNLSKISMKKLASFCWKVLALSYKNRKKIDRYKGALMSSKNYSKKF